VAGRSFCASLMVVDRFARGGGRFLNIVGNVVIVVHAAWKRTLARVGCSAWAEKRKHSNDTLTKV
jgi:hypothetical protein